MRNGKNNKIFSEADFFRQALKKAYEISSCEGVSVFHYCADNGILNGLYRYSGGFFYEISEKIYIDDNPSFKKSALAMKPFFYKLAAAQYYYWPYEIMGDFDLSMFSKENQIFFRFDKTSKDKMNIKKIAAALEFLKNKMENFYMVDFEILKSYYIRNMNSSRRMGEIFASSLKNEDSYKTIISGLQRHFGFDRIRFYVVKESEKKLVGAYSVDIAGKIKQIDYEKIMLEPGSSRFADMVLDKNQENSLEYHNDKIFYLPLKMENKPMGLLIFDNLLSQIKIGSEEREILKSFAGQIAIMIDNINLFNKVEEMSLYDELTGLPLRRYFNLRFQEEFYRAERFSQPLSVLWIDIDYFKEINDTYGHQVGDIALKEVGRVINSTLRKIDFPCRYGGDEIIIMLPQAGQTEACNLGKRLLAEMAAIKIPVPFSTNKEISLSASIGISSYPQDASKMEDLLARADEALYWVKSSGRNAIKAFKELQDKQS